jgi:hypothetical protein
MKQDSCIKRYASGVCPSPAGLPRRALSLARSDGVCVSAAVLTTTLPQVQPSTAFPRFESYRRINQPRPEERARHPEATSETEPTAILARSVPTSAANGLKKSARSAALECYDAARKARCILMTAFSTFRGGAEHVCFRACYVPVWGAAEFAFCQPVQIDDEGSL